MRTLFLPPASLAQEPATPPPPPARMRARGRGVLTLLLVLPLAACGLFQNKEIQKLRKSPDYKVGYQDGCNSAYGPDANKRHDDTIVRDLLTGGDALTDVVMWSEVFARCDAPSAAVMWSELRGFAADGSVISPESVVTNYQSNGNG